MAETRRALVIGGGIAGPVAALALRRAGIDATIYEAYPSTADGIGGTLALAPNGLAALEIVGAADDVRRMAIPIDRTVMSFGSRRVELPWLPDLPPMQLVRRSDLYRALHDRARAAGIAVEYGKRLTSVDEDVTGITARFADGTSARGDVLIGADGVRSTVRTLVDPAAPRAKYTGLLGFEGISRHEVEVAPGTMTFAFGRKGYYLYWPQPGGGTGWGVNLPAAQPLSLTEARAVPTDEWMKTLRCAYGDDEPGGELLRQSDACELQVVGALQIMPPVPRWYRGRMVLVGDSVHAPSNSSGQGASLAIESAIQLARCLRDLPEPEAAFERYVTLRRARVEGIAARAARINQAKAPGRLARLLMPLMMSLLLKTALRPEKSLGPELRYTIDWDAPV
jgi:2-polyprenyl-6-methoxyphenol hydroxylase-like FAD-dependent oxidoreductase